MTLEEIVEKVIERIEAMENRKHLLLIFHPDTKMDLLEEVLVAIDDCRLKVGIVSMGDSGKLREMLKILDIEVINLISREDPIQMTYLMERYDSVLVSGLAIGELYNVSIMNAHSRVEQLILESLISKGKMYALKSVVGDSLIHRDGLLNRLNTLYDMSSEMGIEWIGSTSDSELLEGVITRDLLVGNEKRQIRLAKNSILTPLAREYVATHNIEIKRK